MVSPIWDRVAEINDSHYCARPTSASFSYHLQRWWCADRKTEFLTVHAPSKLTTSPIHGTKGVRDELNQVHSSIWVFILESLSDGEQTCWCLLPSWPLHTAGILFFQLFREVNKADISGSICRWLYQLAWKWKEQSVLIIDLHVDLRRDA